MLISTYSSNIVESTSTPPLPPVSKFYQMLVRNRVRVWRTQWHIPTKMNFSETDQESIRVRES